MWNCRTNHTAFHSPPTFIAPSEPRKVLPILKTDEPVCPEGKLSCGNGECVDKELFCNGKPDCKDESDENACSKYTDSYRNRRRTKPLDK